MKIYRFAKIAARGFPTEAEIGNPYIYGDVRHVINVSEHEYSDRLAAMFAQRGITTVHLPMGECVDGMRAEDICTAVKLLTGYDIADERAVVHCDFGQNRSRTVIEALHYAKYGRHFEDNYKDCLNHLTCNCLRRFISTVGADADRQTGIERALALIGRTAYGRCE